MDRIIQVTVRLIRAGQKAYAKKWSFSVLFAVVFLGSIITLGELDLLPSTKSDLVLGVPDVSSTSATVAVAQSVQLPITAELPLKIEIAKINLSTIVSNPAAADTATLDKELLKGAVRYPTSARLNETGNVVLFGHSSYLPVVLNQAYKTFNEIQKLKAGDVVTVYASLTAYTYRVRSVTKESVSDAQGIPLEVSGRVLTLVTCNSFGTKEDRFVVVADFVDSHSIQP
jgi:LPXTG-site transpeptidase (sortase) family protein